MTTPKKQTMSHEEFSRKGGQAKSQAKTEANREKARKRWEKAKAKTP
jgi:hypothetical protein